MSGLRVIDGERKRAKKNIRLRTLSKMLPTKNNTNTVKEKEFKTNVQYTFKPRKLVNSAWKTSNDPIKLLNQYFSILFTMTVNLLFLETSHRINYSGVVPRWPAPAP